MGDAEADPVRLSFNPQLRVEFQGAAVTGLLLPRELDEHLGLSVLIDRHLTDPRTGRNSQFPLPASELGVRPLGDARSDGVTHCASLLTASQDTRFPTAKTPTISLGEDHEAYCRNNDRNTHRDVRRHGARGCRHRLESNRD